jgi:hypothetical protein
MDMSGIVILVEWHGVKVVTIFLLDEGSVALANFTLIDGSSSHEALATIYLKCFTKS